MIIENRCFKLQLPAGQIVDVLSGIPETISKYVQSAENAPESCGYILGYKDRFTENITLTCITEPHSNDYRSRMFCTLKDDNHYINLNAHRRQKNYFMGTWHTHPQATPTPSSIDFDEWIKTLRYDITGYEYAFFLILGLSQFQIWAGDYRTYEVFGLSECCRKNGLYKASKGGKNEVKMVTHI